MCLVYLSANTLVQVYYNMRKTGHFTCDMLYCLSCNMGSTSTSHLVQYVSAHKLPAGKRYRIQAYPIT